MYLHLVLLILYSMFILFYYKYTYLFWCEEVNIQHESEKKKKNRKT